MKNTTIITLAAMLLGAAGAIAQEAYTKPAGFVTHTLKAGKFNLIGVTLHEAVAVAGAFDTVSGTALTDNDVDFGSTLTAQATYILEITEAQNASLVGTIQEVTTWSSNTITTPQDLASQGLAVGDKYQLRQATTLEKLLGTDNPALTSGFSVTTADVVWLATGPGQYKRCYIKRPTNVWWDADNNVALPNQPICYTDAFFVEKKGSTDADLVITGAVKTITTIAVMDNGFTPISSVFPVGTTLLTSGLENSITAGFSTTTADILWLPDGNGDYNRYYVKRPANAWTKINSNGSQETVDGAGDFAMPSGFFIERKSAEDNVPLVPPTSYSNL